MPMRREGRDWRRTGVGFKCLLWVISRHFAEFFGCPLCPRKQTSAERPTGDIDLRLPGRADLRRAHRLGHPEEDRDTLSAAAG